MESTSTPRTIQPRTTGLRRPNYGPMEHRVLKRFPTTPHVTRRRTVVDENLLVALHQTHIGHQLSSSTGIAGGSSSANEDADQPSPEQAVGTTLIENPFGTGANVDQVWAATVSFLRVSVGGFMADHPSDSLRALSWTIGYRELTVYTTDAATRVSHIFDGAA